VDYESLPVGELPRKIFPAVKVIPEISPPGLRHGDGLVEYGDVITDTREVKSP